MNTMRLSDLPRDVIDIILSMSEDEMLSFDCQRWISRSWKDAVGKYLEDARNKLSIERIYCSIGHSFRADSWPKPFVSHITFTTSIPNRFCARMGVGKWLKIVDEEEAKRGTYMGPGMHVVTASENFSSSDFKYRLGRFFSYTSCVEMLELDFLEDPIPYDIVLKIIGKKSVKSVLISLPCPRNIERLGKLILYLIRQNGICHVHIEDYTLDINYPYLQDEFLFEITQLNVTLDIYGRNYKLHDPRKWEKREVDWNEKGISTKFMTSSMDCFGFRFFKQNIDAHLNIMTNEQRKNGIAYRMPY